MAVIDTDRLIYNKLRVRGVLAQGSGSYRKSIALLEHNVDRLAPLHTHGVPLAEAERGIRMVAGEVPGEEAVCVSTRP